MFVDLDTERVYYNCDTKEYISQNDYLCMCDSYIRHRTSKPIVLILKNNDRIKKEIAFQNFKKAQQQSILDLF